MNFTLLSHLISEFSKNTSVLDQVTALDFGEFPFPWPKEKWQELASSNNSYKVLALLDLDQNLLGFVLYEVYENFEEEQARVNSYIHKVIIRSDKRGQGLGEILLNSFKDYLIKDNCLAIYLDVQEGNHDALRLYEKVGFKKLLKKNKFYSNGDNSLYCLLSLGPS